MQPERHDPSRRGQAPRPGEASAATANAPPGPTSGPKAESSGRTRAGGARRQLQTLSHALQALEGEELVVETSRDTYVRGVLEHCDEHMNVIIGNCHCEHAPTGEAWQAEHMAIRSRLVRMIHLPPDFDAARTLVEKEAKREKDLETLHRRKALMTRKELKRREREGAAPAPR